MKSKKKLKLYGEKNDFKDFIAEIYVEGNTVIVESKDKKVKKELSDAINKAIDKGESFRLPCCIYEHDTIGDGFSLHKLGDPQFLEALQAEFWRIIGLGSPGIFGHRKFGGYKIIAHKSPVVDGKNKGGTD